MKVKNEFILREVAGQKVILAVGKEAVSFSGMIKLNESAALLFEKLKKGADTKQLVNLLTEHYDIDEEKALSDVESFIDILKGKNMFE